MTKRRKIIGFIIIAILTLYIWSFFFAQDLFEVIMPFYEFPRDC